MKIAKSAVRKHAKGRFSHFPRGLNRRFSLLIPLQNYSHAPPFVLQRLTSMTLHIASRSTPSPLQDCNDVLIRNKITLNDHMISIHILPLLSTTTNCLDLALRLVEWRGFCAEWLYQRICVLHPSKLYLHKIGKILPLANSYFTSSSRILASLLPYAHIAPPTSMQCICSYKSGLQTRSQ